MSLNLTAFGLAAGAVRGQLRVSLKNVAFDTALQNVVFQADATDWVEGGMDGSFPRVGAPVPQAGLRGRRERE